MTVDPDDVFILLSEADILSGEQVTGVNGLARRLVKADDADGEIGLARRQRLFIGADQGLSASIGWNRVQLSARVGFSDLMSFIG